MDSVQKLLSFLREDRFNITDELEDIGLMKLGSDVVNEFLLDERSREPWAKQIKEAMDLAKQVMSKKTFPFENASNIKYPLITLATIQFAANTYPQVVANGKVVQAAVLGKDPDKTREQKAQRISDYMSWQLIEESDEWENGLDRLLHSWPILGTTFKKIYYDSFTKKPCFELCAADDIVINNNVKSLESARRITHRFYMHANDILERMRAGIFRDVDIDKLQPNLNEHNSIISDPTGQPFTQSNDDPDALHEILEMHRFMDLDGDGYQEPYIVTVHRKSSTVLRIIPRFDINSLELTSEGKVKRIKAKQYFVDYHFIPSPDGTYYSIGFGTLLTPLNKSINTLINQLIDSGTFANSQTGIIGRSLKFQDSEFKAQMGRFRVADVSASTNIADQIYLFPFKEPSQVLFSLLGVMIEVGEKVANITNILTGTNEVQNVPATTVLETLRQGLKIFSSIQKRLYRSLKKEFELLYEINKEYGDPSIYMTMLNDEFAILKEDFNDENLSIKPVADPNISSSAEKLARLNAIKDLAQLFPAEFNRLEGLKEILEGLEFKNPDKMIIPPNPNAPPPIEQQKLQLEAADRAAKNEIEKVKAQTDFVNSQTKAKQAQIKAVESAAKIEKMKSETILNLSSADQADKHKKMDHILENRKLDLMRGNQNAPKSE